MLYSFIAIEETYRSTKWTTHEATYIPTNEGPFATTYRSAIKKPFESSFFF